MRSIFVTLLGTAAFATSATDPNAVNWTTTSKDSLDSMPLSGRMGAEKWIAFIPVRAREIRLHVLKAERPNINEFQSFQ